MIKIISRDVIFTIILRWNRTESRIENIIRRKGKNLYSLV
jgi:hypothetical protein